MNTQTHAVFNLAVLGKSSSPGLTIPILLGSVLPDLCMFAFYGVHFLHNDDGHGHLWRRHPSQRAGVSVALAAFVPVAVVAFVVVMWAGQ